MHFNYYLNDFVLLFIYSYLAWNSLFSLYSYLLLCIKWIACEDQRGYVIPGTGMIYSCEPSYECWELNISPLKETKCC